MQGLQNYGSAVLAPLDPRTWQRAAEGEIPGLSQLGYSWDDTIAGGQRLSAAANNLSQAGGQKIPVVNSVLDFFGGMGDATSQLGQTVQEATTPPVFGKDMVRTPSGKVSDADNASILNQAVAQHMPSLLELQQQQLYNQQLMPEFLREGLNLSNGEDALGRDQQRWSLDQQLEGAQDDTGFADRWLDLQKQGRGIDRDSAEQTAADAERRREYEAVAGGAWYAPSHRLDQQSIGKSLDNTLAGIDVAGGQDQLTYDERMNQSQQAIDDALAGYGFVDRGYNLATQGNTLNYDQSLAQNELAIFDIFAQYPQVIQEIYNTALSNGGGPGVFSSGLPSSLTAFFDQYGQQKTKQPRPFANTFGW